MGYSQRKSGHYGMSGRAVLVPARAKINLALDVLDRRPDGFHNLRMVMQSVELCDRLIIREADGETPVLLTCDAPRLPVDERNLAFRAAAYMRERFKLERGIHIHLMKSIPVSAGLGGGSSDCAAAVMGIDKLFGLGLTEGRMMEIAGRFGSDAPFCVMGGTALAEGRGEVLTKLPLLEGVAVVIAKPARGASTKEIFRLYDAAEPSASERPDIDKMIGHIQRGDAKGVASAMFNALERVSAGLRPEIPALKAILLANGALGALMSGSGSSVFGLFADEKAAKAAIEDIGRQMPFVRQVFLTKTCAGNKIEDKRYRIRR